MNRFKEEKSLLWKGQRTQWKGILILLCLMLAFSPLSGLADAEESVLDINEEEIVGEKEVEMENVFEDAEEFSELEAIVEQENGIEALQEESIIEETGQEVFEDEEEEQPAENHAEEGTTDAIQDQFSNEDEHVEEEATEVDLQVLPSSDYEWDDNGNGTVTITGYIGADSHLVIPDQIVGKTVTVIGSEAFRSKGLASVQIPNAVEKIESQALSYNDLTSLTLPPALTEMGYRAFYANDLETLLIPEGVQEIGPQAFGYSQLTEIVLPHSLQRVKQIPFVENNLVSVTVNHPDTEFVDDSFENNQDQPADLTIFGYDPSTAKTFAEVHNYSFSSLAPAIDNVPELEDRYLNYGTLLEDIDLPETVEAGLTDGGTITVPLIWDEGTPAFQAQTPGTYLFVAQLDHPMDFANPQNLVVTLSVIISEPFVIGVEQFNPIEVPYGTEQDAIPFPEEALVTMVDESEMTLSIHWIGSTPDYEHESPGSYMFHGAFEQEELIHPGEFRSLSIEVIVLSKGEPIEDNIDQLIPGYESPEEEPEETTAEEDSIEETAKDELEEESKDETAPVEESLTSGSGVLPQTNQRMNVSLYAAGFTLILLAGLLYTRKRKLV